MREDIWKARAKVMRACAGQGLSKSETAKKLGVCASTVTTYAQRFGIAFAEKRGRPQYDRDAFSECAVKLRDQGMKARQAASAAELSYETFTARCRRAGIVFPHALHVPHKERAESIASMFRSGKTMQEIGDLYGISRERVRQILERQSVDASEGGVSARAQAHKRILKEQRDVTCLAKNGCTYSQLQSLRDIAREMVAAGASRYRTPIQAFNSQRSNARRRGIDWNLKLWDWWRVWQKSGKWGARGRGQGYVMCRFGDEGTYELGNVYIATAVHNSTVQPNNPYRKDHPDFEKAVELLRKSHHKRPDRGCQIKGCDNNHYAHGLCQKHYCSHRYQEQKAARLNEERRAA